mmetsp:Transcript_19411/g.42392  ORF Transcript_19411/g.42392 Transcript_19411/m.42392 type:complete len:225 (+) Transcript_19411:1545-2219(+)
MEPCLSRHASRNRTPDARGESGWNHCGCGLFQQGACLWPGVALPVHTDGRGDATHKGGLLLFRGICVHSELAAESAAPPLCRFGVLSGWFPSGLPCRVSCPSRARTEPCGTVLHRSSTLWPWHCGVDETSASETNSLEPRTTGCLPKSWPALHGRVRTRHWTHRAQHHPFSTEEAKGATGRGTWRYRGDALFTTAEASLRQHRLGPVQKGIEERGRQGSGTWFA